MEQWVVDGRRVIQERGFSLVPRGVEKSEGFDTDLSGGKMRGLLSRKVQMNPVPAETQAWCPMGESPRQNTECLIKVAYFFERALADVNGFTKEELCNLRGGAYAADFGVGKVPEWSDDALEPLSAVVGAGQVIQGIEEGLLTMVAGEVRDFYCDPGFAFRGDILKAKLPGCLGIPPDAPVIVVVELISFEHEANAEERVERGERVKNDANKLLQQVMASRQKQREQKAAAAHQLGSEVMEKKNEGDISDEVNAEEEEERIGDTLNAAIQLYHKAFEKTGGKRAAYRYRGSDPAYKQRDIALRSALFSNLATCWTLKPNHSTSASTKAKVVEFCNKALEENAQHVKARFRRAGASESTLDFEAALSDLYYLLDSTLVVMTAAEKAEVEAAIIRIKAKDEHQTKGQNKAYKKMFWAASAEEKKDDSEKKQQQPETEKNVENEEQN